MSALSPIPDQGGTDGDVPVGEDEFEDDDAAAQPGVAWEAMTDEPVMPLAPSSPSQAASLPRTGPDPIVEHLKSLGRPVTREAYLAFAYPEGVEEPLDAELEAMLPPELRLTE